MTDLPETLSDPLSPLVGIAASAGGLEAIERFFRALPPKPGIAFVVVQHHLSPDFKSLMDELMARFSDLTILNAPDGAVPEIDHVYLTPPGQEIELVERRLRLFPCHDAPGPTLPIDRFFDSIARERGRDSVVVVLSGRGSDGSRGAKRVHEVGGLVLVEDPAQARLDGMPRAAIETGAADVILPADQLATMLVDRGSDGDDPASANGERKMVAQILSILRSAFAVDFAQYKLPTVMRRIRRRVALLHLQGIAAYVDALQSNVDEVDALAHDLLIGVTRFYRDPATWETLETRALPELLEQADPARGLRAWVAGCATGEEAYSMAMTLLDLAEGTGVPVKVFATDVHRGALERAARGVYAASSLDGVSSDRRRRYFVARTDGDVQATQQLRNAVVFAHHNILKDAPFTNLDVVSCRNLLIYLLPGAQRQALSFMQYGLRLGGVMMLGPSENLGEVGADFERIDEAHRLYRKARVARRLPDLTVRASGQEFVVRSQPPQAESELLRIYDAVLDRVMPATLLVSPDLRLLDSFGGAESYLRHNRRRPSNELLELVPTEARLTVSGAVARAARGRERVRFERVRWAGPGGEAEFVDIEVDPLPGPDGPPRAYLVYLTTPHEAAVAATAPVVTIIDAQDVSAERVRSLEAELFQARASLQTTVEELETSGEEMQATNEALVSSNEELQSTNEELQSVNEELHTVNSELHTRNSELSDLNRDLQHLFESIDVGLIFLDEQLRIRRFTTAAADLFGLMAHDVGRALGSFHHPLRRRGLIADLTRCRDRLEDIEYEVEDHQGQTHLVRMKAHKDNSGRVDVVLSITNLTPLAAARAKVDLLSAVVATTDDAVIALDRRGRITAWNASAQRLYGYTEDEALGASIEMLVPAGLRGELAHVLSGVWRGEVRALETHRQTKDGALVDVSVKVSPIYDARGEISGASKIDRDITERLARERALAERERRLTDLYDNSPDMFTSTDLRTGRLVECNETLLRATGYAREELVGAPLFKLYPAEDAPHLTRLVSQLREQGELRDVELQIRRKDGTTLDVSISATLVRDEKGEPLRSRTVIRDISARQQAIRALAEAARLREQFLAIVSHELRTPLYAVRSAAEILTQASSEPEKQHRALEVLRRQTAHMTRLIEDLVDVSLMLNDRLKLEQKSFDLRAAARAAVDGLLIGEDSVVQRGVSIEIRGADAPLMVNGDFTRLQQAITNLLTNAVRHSPSAGKVVVDLSAADGRVRLAVRDQGEGIPADRLESIFTPFGAPAEHGTGRRLGIGLSVARRVIEGHGGTLTASSAGERRGSEFRIELPLRETAAVKRSKEVGGGALHLVVVEDQPDSLEMITMLLEMRGHTVGGAATGAAGIEAIVRDRPDVALVDIGLPDMSGYDVARAVRERIGDDVPLVALTGYSQPGDIERSLDAGFVRHLVKPLDTALIEQAVHEVRARV